MKTSSWFVVLGSWFAAGVAMAAPLGAQYNADVRFSPWTNRANIASATAETNGAFAAGGTWYYAVQPSNHLGLGVVSAPSGVTVSATGRARITWQYAGGADAVRIWRGSATNALTNYIAQSAGATNFLDYGTNAWSVGTALATATNTPGIVGAGYVVFSDGTTQRTAVAGGEATNATLVNGISGAAQIIGDSTTTVIETSTTNIIVHAIAGGSPNALTNNGVTFNGSPITNGAALRQSETNASARVRKTGDVMTGTGLTISNAPLLLAETDTNIFVIITSQGIAAPSAQLNSLSVSGDIVVNSGGTVVAPAFNDGGGGLTAQFSGQFVGNGFGLTNLHDETMGWPIITATNIYGLTAFAIRNGHPANSNNAPLYLYNVGNDAGSTGGGPGEMTNIPTDLVKRQYSAAFQTNIRWDQTNKDWRVWDTRFPYSIIEPGMEGVSVHVGGPADSPIGTNDDHMIFLVASTNGGRVQSGPTFMGYPVVQTMSPLFQDCGPNQHAWHNYGPALIHQRYQSPTTSIEAIHSERIDNALTGPIWARYKANGTIDSKLIVSNRAIIGTTIDHAWNGATNSSVAAEYTQIAGVPSATSMPSRFVWQVTPTNATIRADAMRLEPNGDLIVSGRISAAGSYIGSGGASNLTIAGVGATGVFTYVSIVAGSGATVSIADNGGGTGIVTISATGGSGGNSATNPFFVARNGTNQVWTAPTITTKQLDTVVTNIGGFAFVTNTWRCPMPGVYDFDFQAIIRNWQGGVRIVPYLYSNGVINRTGLYNSGGTNASLLATATLGTDGHDVLVADTNTLWWIAYDLSGGTTVTNPTAADASHSAVRGRWKGPLP